MALLNTLPYDHWNLPLTRIHTSGWCVLIFYFSLHFEKAATGLEGDSPMRVEEVRLSQILIRESSPFFFALKIPFLLIFPYGHVCAMLSSSQ